MEGVEFKIVDGEIWMVIKSEEDTKTDTFRLLKGREDEHGT